MIKALATLETRMRAVLRPINLQALVLLIVLGCGLTSQATRQSASSAEKGHGSGGTPAADHPDATPHNHSVTLSWGVSTPASKMSRDAVVGYNVYRSAVSHDRSPKRVNSALCASTIYTDSEVEAGKTYFYVTRGVTAKGVEGGPSNEIEVVMPPR
jgi:hypothetical protein